MATLNRTVTYGMKGDRYLSAYVSVDAVPIVPELITRFSPGSRVEVRRVSGELYGVQAAEGSPLRVFGEESWHPAAV